MARYIDADLLLKDIDESVVFSVRSGKTSSEIRGANKIIDRIKNAPTADVVEVVRCKDCMFCLEGYNHENVCSAMTNPNYVNLDHFCSYGERRTDNECI